MRYLSCVPSARYRRFQIDHSKEPWIFTTSPGGWLQKREEGHEAWEALQKILTNPVNEGAMLRNPPRPQAKEVVERKKPRR